MRRQTTVDQTLIRGLVTRIDRCSSGGCSMSGARALIRLSATDYLLRFPHRGLTAGAVHLMLSMSWTPFFLHKQFGIY
jgi:hypothetical protein